MVIKNVNLETVCGITSKLPDHTLPEIAFAGKSNVGKSSLINALMNRKALARTSAKPGKTQTINFYNINEEMYLVDLPGYGYAKAVSYTHLDVYKRQAAICAAPTVFGGMGILKGKKAICYPGMEEGLTGAEVTCQPAVTDGHITTSRGLGTAIDFALALISELRDKESADTISKQVVYER